MHNKFIPCLTDAAELEYAPQLFEENNSYHNRFLKHTDP